MSTIASNHAEYIGSIAALKSHGLECHQSLLDATNAIKEFEQISQGNTTNEWLDISAQLKHSSDKVEEFINSHAAAHSSNQESIQDIDQAGLSGGM